MALVTAKDVRKDYRVGENTIPALKGLSFQIEPGAFVSFVGPSGSGKTTLLNLIGCLDSPTDGRLDVAGIDVSSLDRKQGARFRGGNIGFIFQDFNLIPVLTVYENVEYPLLTVKPAPPAERRRRVESLLNDVGMLDQKDKYPDQISGGQKQRAAVARALVTGPRLVLADEPTANLDSATGIKIIELMRSINEAEQTTFIFSTHDAHIMREARSVVNILDGMIVGADGAEG